MTRTLSGIVIVLVTVSAVLVSQLTLLLFALLVTVVSMWEFLRLDKPVEGERNPLSAIYPILIGTCTVVLTYLATWNGYDFLLLLLPLVFTLFIVQLFRKHDVSPMNRIGREIMAILYIAVPMALLAVLGKETGEYGEPVYNAWFVLLYIILIWINDVGAYLVGVTLGKHRLCERLSPKKSWEGFFGGVLFTVVAACLLGPRITGLENTSLWGWIFFGIILTLSAVAGDLVESMFKREAGVKDSGNIIPGHGGFLDRFDSVFISIPFVYVMKLLMM